jgi:hypothetical protein
MRNLRWLAALPFLGILVGPFFLNRVEPFVFGLPLLLAWLVFCVIGTSAVMGADLPDRPSEPRAGGSPMSVALVIVAAGFALAIGLGLYARLGREMGLEQWTVGGRGFGTAPGLPADGRGDLHDLHVPRRLGHRLREGAAPPTTSSAT